MKYNEKDWVKGTFKRIAHLIEAGFIIFNKKGLPLEIVCIECQFLNNEISSWYNDDIERLDIKPKHCIYEFTFDNGQFLKGIPGDAVFICAKL